MVSDLKGAGHIAGLLKDIDAENLRRVGLPPAAQPRGGCRSQRLAAGKLEAEGPLAELSVIFVVSCHRGRERIALKDHHEGSRLRPLWRVIRKTIGEEVIRWRTGERTIQPGLSPGSFSGSPPTDRASSFAACSSLRPATA